jgi:hypothetical protein
MSDTKNVLPMLVDLATKLAGEDQTNDWLRTVRGGPSEVRIYTPEDLGLNAAALGTAASSNWVDVAGFRTIVAFVRVTGTYGGAAYGVDLVGTPVGAGDTWGNETQWGVSLGNRSNLTAFGSFLIANTGAGNYASSTSWTGCVARKVRVDIGAAGASALGSAYLICLP